MLYDELTEMALAEGVTKATVIEASQVVLSGHFAEVCKSNQCGNYGRNWACPPYAKEIDGLMEEVKSYPHCLLFQIISTLEDSFDVEGMQEAGHRLCMLSQEIKKKLPAFLKKPYLQLADSCSLCETCARKTGADCVHPDLVIPSISGYGIDVNATTSGTDLKYINGKDTVTNFGMVFFSE